MGGVSQANVDFVLDGYARFNAGERRPELWFWHPDAEYHVSQTDPDAAIHRGIDAIRSQFASWVEAYPDLKVEPLEAKGNGDQVFLWVRFAGHGASSGLPIDMKIAHVYTLHHGKVARLVEYTNRDEALEAAGLPKQGVRAEAY
jgi:ketosteroid isomerase-like protein